MKLYEENFDINYDDYKELLHSATSRIDDDYTDFDSLGFIGDADIKMNINSNTDYFYN